MSLHVRESLAAVLVVLAATACDHASTNPGSGSIQFSRSISLPDAQSLLQTGPARVDVGLIPGTLVARRVAIETTDELARPEEVRSRINAISATADQGTVTLELGGLKVGFNSSTQFRPDDGDSHEHDARMLDGGGTTLADFVARVQADLAAGRHPAVKARRAPPATPQAPGDATFLATELRRDQDNEHPRISLNVTGANLVTSPTSPPDAVLKLLGMSIELRVSDGTTRLQAQNPEVEGERDFEGMVRSVDQTANTVTLADGTVIHIVSGTEVDAREGDDDEHLASLTEVQAALAASRAVKAEGEGLVTAASPLTLDAVKIEFEAEELPASQP